MLTHSCANFFSFCFNTEPLSAMNFCVENCFATKLRTFYFIALYHKN